MKRSQRFSRNGEHGAVAVEFALVAPLLLALIAGIVEFSYAYNTQISVSQAAREASRTYAITKVWSKATDAGIAGAPGSGLTASDFALTPTTCSGTDMTVQVTVKHTFKSPTGFALKVQGSNISFSKTFVTTGVGAMRCGG
ncbi:TadE/TadG family type IV pilus assembly protein [Pseudarthrobacter sulfonivorans]|uniref:TadE/TadG family type IV pilus assembly protein n=1 Tax=Pseudarthrobacter sulfonivorans TaxID=121292 RepID=UPI002783742D|nr:TadE/TadG family type IV pilus assembly protein [Pseudarthrobacter sulfonivorans]MDP9997763.1 Flp pilus assembly protein TadG [Pseudarthrobacter sulfonivorans]